MRYNRGILDVVFTATGKSPLARKFKNVIDMESTNYKYIGNCDESNKSTNREINKEWPNNYFKALESVKDKYKYIGNNDEKKQKYQ